MNLSQNKKSPYFNDFQKSWETKTKTLGPLRDNQSLRKPLELLKGKKRKKLRSRRLRTNNPPLSNRKGWWVKMPRRTKIKKYQKVSSEILEKQMREQKAQGVIQARFTLTNTHLNLQTFEGQTLLKTSAGCVKNVKKSTPFANFILGETFGKKCLKMGFKYIYFNAQGSSRSRKTVFKGISKSGVKFVRVSLQACIPHNGCRPPRLRRLLFEVIVFYLIVLITKYKVN